MEEPILGIEDHAGAVGMFLLASGGLLLAVAFWLQMTMGRRKEENE